MIEKPVQRYDPPRMTVREYFAKKDARAARREQHKKDLRALLKAGGTGQQNSLLKPSRSLVKAQLFHLTSLIVRRRDQKLYAGYCCVCMVARHLGYQTKPPQPITLSYHIFSRAESIIAFDLINQVGACVGCNKRELESRRTVKGRATLRHIHETLIGKDEYARLEALAVLTDRRTTAELIDLRDLMKEKLEGRNA